MGVTLIWTAIGLTACALCFLLGIMATMEFPKLTTRLLNYLYGADHGE